MHENVFEIIFTVLVVIYVAKINAQLPTLDRILMKNGFHKDLETVLTLPAPLLPDFGKDVDCFFLFTETIPSGAYIDPYQLNALKPYGGPDAVVMGLVDIEQPEFTSSSFDVHVYSNISVSGDKKYSSYTIPIHLRYHGVSSSEDYATVTIQNPEIAVRCYSSKLRMAHHGYHGNIKNTKTEKCSSDSKLLCDWLVIEYRPVHGDISVSVPVGREEHYIPVVIATLVMTLSGCCLLMYKALSYMPKPKVN